MVYLFLTKQVVKMGQEVFVLATLPEQAQKIPLICKGFGFHISKHILKPQGFMIQLAGEKGVYYKMRLRDCWLVQKRWIVQVLRRCKLIGNKRVLLIPIAI